MDISFMKTKFGNYPIVFALKTLRAIQGKYGTLEKWGERAMNKIEPDVDAITFCLMHMINTGLALDAFKNNKEIKEVTQDEAEFILQDFGIEEGVILMGKKLKEGLPKISKNAKATGNHPKKSTSRG